MVLESLLGYEIKKPAELFGTGLFFSTIAVFLSSALFSHAPSMVVVTFMTIPSIYVLMNINSNKCEEEIGIHSFRELLHKNFDLVEMYLFLFLGMMVGVSFWFSVLPKDVVAVLFSEQLYNLQQIGVSTAYASVGMAASSSELFSLIAVNNLKLVILCAVLSFIFGSGAMFILSWNASVVGVAIGLLIVKLKAVGIATGAALAQGFATGIAYYILHLVPEVVAYFYAAIAGGFISLAMMKYRPFSHNSNKLLIISFALLGFAIVLIIIAAMIEVNISYPIQAGLKSL